VRAGKQALAARSTLSLLRDLTTRPTCVPVASKTSMAPRRTSSRGPRTAFLAPMPLRPSVATGTPIAGRPLAGNVAEPPVSEATVAGGTVEIGSMTVLPAVRTDIELHTEDGLTLVGELALPVSGHVAATLICLHPLPTHGGFMDSHVLRKASWRLPALADVAVLRFNTRGTTSPRGTSQGAFDDGVGEGADVRAAVAYAVAQGLPHRWLLGWSFGTELALMHGADQDVEGAILLSPPLRRATPPDLDRWAVTGKPVMALVPEFDDFLRPAQARESFTPLTQLELVEVPEAKHLWVGERFVRIVLDAIVARVVPGRAALPTHVDASVLQH